MQNKSNPHLVVQSNQFINLRHTLSLAEARVFLSMVAQIEREDDDFKTYRIDVKDFSDMVGLKGQSSYSALKEVAESLRYKEFKTLRQDGGWLVMGYISSAEYLPGQGVVELSFDPKLKPYLLGLKEAFTQYDIRYIISLRSIHSVRIYELLKQYERIRVREFDLQELKYKLNIDDKYKRYTDFKTNVLEIAKRDLMKATDIYFEYEEIKQGRFIKRIRFNIFSKNPNQSDVEVKGMAEPLPESAFQPIIIVQALNPLLPTMFQEFDPKLSHDAIEQFMEGIEDQEDSVLDALFYARQEKLKGTQIRNIFAYVRKGLETALGKGLFQQAKNRKKQEDAVKRQENDNREISHWYSTEFATYLSNYFIKLGKEASPAVKNKFVKYAENLVKENPKLKHLYFDSNDKPNQEQMRLALGKALSEEEGETDEKLFANWCLRNKNVIVEKQGNQWLLKDNPRKSEIYEETEEIAPF